MGLKDWLRGDAVMSIHVIYIYLRYMWFIHRFQSVDDTTLAIAIAIGRLLAGQRAWRQQWPPALVRPPSPSGLLPAAC